MDDDDITVWIRTNAARFLAVAADDPTFVIVTLT